MSIEVLKKAIAPARLQVITHPLYARIKSLEELQLFTQHHVFAVWDFMSLLKSLQQQLTCIHIPWLPTGSATTRYLINEIVTGEESDIDPTGVRCSHFELYLKAMQQLGADTTVIDTFIHTLQQGTPVQKALQESGLPDGVKAFCNYTFSIIATAPVHVQAAVFTFGREDLIPDMFHEMVQGLAKEFPGHTATFRYYLERHIEVDGGHHSELALQMVTELCGTDEEKWNEAAAASSRALELRSGLWDAVLQTLDARELVLS